MVSRKSYEENSLTFPFRKSEQSFFEFRKSSRFHTFGQTCGHSTARGSSIANHPLVIIISSDPTIAHPWRPTRFPIFQLPRGEVLVHFHVGKKRAVYDSSCSRFFERVCEISATVTATATPPIDMSRGIIPVRVPVGDPSSWVGVGLISKGSSIGRPTEPVPQTHLLSQNTTLPARAGMCVTRSIISRSSVGSRWVYSPTQGRGRGPRFDGVSSSGVTLVDCRPRFTQDRNSR